MFNLSNLFGRGAHIISENKRIISEQRAKIDPFSIVSIDEFLEKVINPQLEESGPSKIFFSKYANRIEKTLFHWLNFDQFESFNVTFDMMSEENKNLMIERYNRKSAQMTEIELLQDIKDTLEGDQPELLENSHYPTLYVAHIIQAIDAVTEKKNCLLDLEKKSINSGHAQSMMNFWWRLEGLKDYSTFFPHKPKPQGNNHDDGQKESKIQDWFPDFGGGLNGWQPT